MINELKKLRHLRYGFLNYWHGESMPCFRKWLGDARYAWYRFKRAHIIDDYESLWPRG